MDHREAAIEQTKCNLEYLRHLSTLSTGSIILIVTFLEKIFQRPVWKYAVVVSLIGFVISIMASLVAYTFNLSVGFGRSSAELPDSTKGILGWGFLFTWAGFFIGITSLSVFAIRNLME